MSQNIKVIVNRSDLVGIADSIRDKTGNTDGIRFGEFTTNISGIVGAELPSLDNPATGTEVFEGYEVINERGQKQIGTFTIDGELATQDNLITQIQKALVGKASSGSGNNGDDSITLQDKTVTPTTSTQIVTADAGYDGLNIVTVNAMPAATQATPVVTINESTGLITATTTQNAGYVTAGTKSGTKQLTIQATQTITPGTSDKTIASGTYLTGTQTIKGDANLVASNIKSGTSIFGVTGNYEGSGSGGATENYENELLAGTITSYTNDTLSALRGYAFYQTTSLTNVNMATCKNIGAAAFSGCT